MGELLALLAAFFFAFSNIYAKTGMVEKKTDTYNGLIISVVVNNLINIIILPFVFLFSYVPSINWYGLAWFALSGVLTSFLGRFLLFECIERIGASRATTLKVSAPVFSVLLGVFLLGERLSTLVVLGIIIVLLGSTIISRDTQKLLGDKQNSASKVNTTSYQKHISLGILIGLLAGLGFGLGNIFRKLGVEYFPNPLLGVAIASFTSLLCLLIFPYVYHKVSIDFQALKQINGQYLKVGILTSLALYSTFFALLLSPVSIVNSLIAVEPLCVIVLGMIILRKYEIISASLVIGALTVTTGVAFIFMFQ